MVPAFVSRLWARVRRHPGVAAVLASLALILIVVAYASVRVVQTKWQTSGDGIAALGDAFAGGAVLLAIFGSVLAALAYGQSVRHPRMTVRAWLVFSDAFIDPSTGEVEPQRRVKTYPVGPAPFVPWNDGLRTAAFSLEVIVGNTGEATARNVTVSIELLGVQSVLEPAPSTAWSLVRQDRPRGETLLQWEGGSDLAVHAPPPTQRRLPTVRFRLGFVHTAEKIRLHATAFADGSRPAHDTFDMDIEPPHT